mmetsp:Transcript_52823/g.86247  ORF Transcript_52823/g.86247 Transcript_52823/m.86247 type:complete len:499 (+) Transcript_52823:25-1521(+)
MTAMTGSSADTKLSKELVERAAAGRHQDVDRLLKDGADKDWADYNGYTALSEAAMAGHTIVVGQLLRANADPNRQASDGRTALHRAAFHGWIPILRLLLEHGADPELKDTDDRTAAELTRKESVTEVIAKGTEEHREIIEKRRLERPKEPLKEVKTVPNLPKRSGPVTRRLVPETASDQDGKQDAQDSKDPRDPRDPKDPKDKENQENQSKDSKDGKDGKDGKFLELHSSLDIVTRPDDFAGRGGPGGYQGEVRLQQGSLIVETSDGLFSSDEVKRDEQGPSPEEKAEVWLQNIGDISVIPNLDSVMKAKSQAQELFNAQQVSEARKVTTAAIRAAAVLLAKEDEMDLTERSSQREDLKTLFGVLHSNRSLLLMNQIQSNDEEVLQFGSHAAWTLVVKDTDAALRQNPSNFKASFRRAKALFELGELEQAMVDATKVVDHYARNTQVSNPEAVALRQAIQQQLKKERAKWGDKGGPRWNRAAQEASPLISEVGPEYAA